MHRPKPAEKKHLDVDSTSPGACAVSLGSEDSSQKDKWLVDSGASSHMTQDKELLSDYREFEKSEKVELGDGHVVNAVGIGKVRVNMLFKMSKSKESVIHEVLYVPKLTCNLFSVRAATARGNNVKFGKFRCWIKDRKKSYVVWVR